MRRGCLDFEDFLRHRRLHQWEADGTEASVVRAVPHTWRKNQTDRSDLTDLSDPQRWALYSRWLDAEEPALRANAIICLIHQANFLLDRQISALERAFIEGGGNPHTPLSIDKSYPVANAHCRHQTHPQFRE